MNWKKLGKALLYPPIAMMIALVPFAAICLVGAMLRFASDSPPAIAAYVLAFYTLSVWCVRTPDLIRWIKCFRQQNRLARRWFDDEHLRVNVSLYGSFFGNVAYAVFWLCLGIYHTTAWYCSLAVYYLLLAVMRLSLARYTVRHRAGERMREELLRYRATGWVLLAMTLALSTMIFFMVWWNRTFLHHEVTTIAMAAYTFTALTVSIVGLVQYRRYQSPVYSASKAIGLAAASVSMLTLESTMLTTFGGETMPLSVRRIFLATSGAAVTALIVTIACYMIASGTKKLKLMERENTTNGTT